jgi:phosphatidyl-myo-inositol dimannoside synthase
VVEGETGWVVPGRSVTAVAARVSMLLADPAGVRAAGEKGRAWVEREWRWDGLAARLGGLLRE